MNHDFFITFLDGFINNSIKKRSFAQLLLRNTQPKSDRKVIKIIFKFIKTLILSVKFQLLDQIVI